jgi:hypothetical protein
MLQDLPKIMYLCKSLNVKKGVFMRLRSSRAVTKELD